MKKYFIILLSIYYSNCFSQEKLVKDIDFDGTKDTVSIDDTGFIVCKLSSNKFKKIESKHMEISSLNSRIANAKNGLELRTNWMRAGNASQFRYNKTVKKIQLIGMSRYELGNAANDGSGESSVNLLTGDYIGNWNYFDNQKRELIKIPAIKTKMFLPKTFLENFSDEVCYDYIDRCATLFERNKERILKTKK